MCINVYIYIYVYKQIFTFINPCPANVANIVKS